jgi:hypothetical protein
MVLSDDRSNNINFTIEDAEFSNELNVCRRCVSMNIKSRYYFKNIESEEIRLIVVNKLLASMVHKNMVMIANEKGGPCVVFKDGEFGKATNAGPDATSIDPFITRSELERILDEREQRKV